MTRLLLDSDAFLCLRQISLLSKILAASEVELLMAEYAARYELNSLHDEIVALNASGRLDIVAVKRRTTADSEYRRLRRAGVDKGEAEAIAWARHANETTEIVFVTLDKRARGAASDAGLSSLDVFGVGVLLVDRDILTRSQLETHAQPWEDRRNQFGRPPDFTTFDETFERRRSRAKS